MSLKRSSLLKGFPLQRIRLLAYRGTLHFCFVCGGIIAPYVELICYISWWNGH